MRLVKKLLNHTETYVILIALLFGVAVETVSHQFFSNTGMVNLARISMILPDIWRGGDALARLRRAGRILPGHRQPVSLSGLPVSLEARITRAPF